MKVLILLILTFILTPIFIVVDIVMWLIKTPKQ